MSELELFKIHNFTGLNLRDADYLVSDTEITGGQNAVLNEMGKPSKRYGYVVAHEMPSNPKSIYRFYQNNGATKTTVITAGASLYHGTTEKYTALTSGKTFYFQMYGESLYMVNSADGLIKDDGSTVTDVTPLTLSGLPLKAITRRMERLWVADNTSLYYSDLGAPETFDSNSLINVELSEGETITNIANLYNNIIVFSHRNIQLVRGDSNPDTYALENLHSSFGLIAPKSLVEVDGELIGLSRDGLFAFNGSVARLLPNYDKIKPLIDGADPETLENACAVVYDRKIMLTFPNYGSAYNDLTIVFDLNVGAWLPKWTNITAAYYCVFDGQGDSNELYFCSSTGNNVYKFNTGFTDNGTAIDWSIETKNFDVETPERYKKFKKNRVEAQTGTGTLNFHYAVDGNTYSTATEISLTSSHTWGEADFDWGDSANWGDGLGIINYKVSNSSTGKRIKYKFRHNGASDVKLVGFSQFFRSKKAK